ncbi:MAG TPA: histidine kinase [Cyclobacteriaceae bacterium]|nr:histidine kinase [Cyclobacteriaceae bacterium]
MHVNLKYPLAFLLWVLVIPYSLWAQQSPQGFRSVVITDVLETPVDTFSIEYVSARQETLFHSTNSLSNAKIGLTYWFRLDFYNEKENLTNSDTIFLATGTLFRAEIFLKDSVLRSIHVDYTSPVHYSKAGPSSLTIPIAVSSLIDGRFLYMKIRFFRGTPLLKNFAFSYNTESGEVVNRNFVSIRSVESQVPVFVLIGIAGLLAILNLILFLFTRERQYLYYIFFLIFQVIYYSRGSSLVSYFLFHDKHFVSFTVTEMAQVAANLSYVLFVRYFLETRNTLPLLDKILLAVSVALMLFIGVDTVVLISNPFFDQQLQVMNAQRYFMAAFALLGVIYLMIKATGNLRYFVMGGTIAYAGGALTTMFGGRLEYMIIGSAVENVIFAIGLSYKIRSITVEKMKFERETSQVKMSALRAQINPHFIFNSLNSIQHLISKSDKVNALKYLTKFSTLLRQMLENSLHVNIPLKNEIELLRIYLELESMRFDGSFQYQITVNNTLDVDNLELPILLLQPYVENAINHGLLPKRDGVKELHISFTDHDHYVRCAIKDTGIGRQASAEMKKGLKVTRPSRGLELSQQRLRLMNRDLNLDDLITIIDS